jgi:hypothetical protein
MFDLIAALVAFGSLIKKSQYRAIHYRIFLIHPVVAFVLLYGGLSLEIVETDKLGGLRLTVVDVTELTDNVKKIRQVRSEVSMVFRHFNLYPHHI